MPTRSTQLLTILRDLLVSKAVKTQDDIKEALLQLGFKVNQSKISRLLHKLGAIKTKNELGEIVYQLPKEPLPPTISSELAHLVIDVVNNEMLIIVHTSPGSASLIARVIDHHQQHLKILGTVAGDDTVVVIPKSIQQIQAIIKDIESLLLIKLKT